MARLSDAQLVQVAAGAGFKGDALATAVAVALAESGGNPTARGVNVDGSVDRGLWQINSRWHKEVSTAQANNPSSAAAAAYRISKSGTDWTPWSTYKAGRHRAFLGRARRAINTARLTGATNVDWKDNLEGLGNLLGDKLGGLPTPGLGGLELVPGLDAPDIGDTLDAIKAVGTFIAKTYAWVSNPHNWLRIVLAAGGAAAVLAGLALLAGSSKPVQTVAGAASNVVPIGKLARRAAA